MTTVICWHGLARNGHDFDHLSQVLLNLLPNFRVVVIDTPGRGQSDWLKNKDDYNYATYLHIANIIMAKFSESKAIYWVGTSMGGILGMMLCSVSENCPIKKLVLVDIGPEVSAQALKRIGDYVGKVPKFSSLKDAKIYLMDINRSFGPNIPEEEWKHMAKYMTNKTQNNPTEYVLHYDPSISQPFKGENDLNLWHFWNSIKTPVFLIHGAQSDILTDKIVQKMKEIGPKLKKYLKLSDCGHAPHLITTETCNPIFDFLKEE